MPSWADRRRPWKVRYNDLTGKVHTVSYKTRGSALQGINNLKYMLGISDLSVHKDTFIGPYYDSRGESGG